MTMLLLATDLINASAYLDSLQFLTKMIIYLSASIAERLTSIVFNAQQRTLASYVELKTEF